MGFGIGCGKTERGCTLLPSVSAGSMSDLQRVGSEIIDKTTSQLPLDLSVTTEPKTDTVIVSLPLDLTSTMHEKPSIKDALDKKASPGDPLTLSPPVK